MEYTSNYQLRKPVIGVDLADIRDLNRNADTIDAIMNHTQNSLAPAYDTSAEYNTGDVVMYEMLMYECLEDEVTGNWDSTKWQRTTAGQHGGGSDVSITPTLQSGTKIAEYEVDGVQGELYAPTGGGGGGNLSDLGDVNINSPTDGQTLVYDATNQEWINGSGGGEGGSGGGMFIDTSNVIQAFTQIRDTQEHTYTATQDCAINYVTANSPNTNTYIKIDNVQVGGQYTEQGICAVNDIIFLRKGQTFSFQQTFTGSTTTGYTVYGITYTTQNIQPQIYSLEEREVGVWIDGKPLYQRTLTPNEVPDLDITGETRNINLGLSNIEHIWLLPLSAVSNNAFPLPYVHYDNTNEIGYWWDMNNGSPILCVRVGNNSVSQVIDFITILYTKTTDTAGSGSWTPSGVPAHHYSTDEQVVGTWIDGSTVYERTIATNITVLMSRTTITSIMDFSNIKQIISCTGFYTGSGGEGVFPLNVYRANGAVIARSSEDATLDHITFRYTKSS